MVKNAISNTYNAPTSTTATNKLVNADGDSNQTKVQNTHPSNLTSTRQLQSPQPQPTAAIDANSPITQVHRPNPREFGGTLIWQSFDRSERDPSKGPPKSRHRGLFSQLLCCFKPTSSTNNADSYRANRDAAIARQQDPQKYSNEYLLPDRQPSDNRICLVIDLDETLVHSSFKPIENADFIVPVEIDGTLSKVYVSKRPHVDEFLKRMGHIYECVLFTASLAKYADPVADLLDKENIFKARLFRQSCAFYRGNYIKDLNRLGRDLSRVIIIDNSPASYLFHPDNALPVSSYFDNQNDDELLNLIPLLERIATKPGSVVPISSCHN